MKRYAIAIFLLIQCALAQNVTANPPLQVPNGIPIVARTSNELTDDPGFLWNPASYRWDVPVGFNMFLGNERFFSMYPNNGHTSANMFLGLSSGNQTTSGYNNVAFGISSLGRVTTGSGNTALSHDTLDYVTTGNNNTAVGYRALEYTTQSANSALGWSAAHSVTTGFAETAVGYATLYRTTTAAYDTAMGFKALQNEQTGGNNVAIGALNGANTIAGQANTFVGTGAGAEGDYSDSGAFGANAQATKSHQIALGTPAEEVYAPGSFNSPLYQVSGTPGATRTISLIGSNGTPCQLVFSGGLLTSTTCP
jgi:hypothetical protein